MVLFESVLILLIFLIPIILLIPTILLSFWFLKQAITQKKKIFIYLSILFSIYLAGIFFDIAQNFSRSALSAQGMFIMAQVFRIFVLYILVLLLEFYSQNIEFSGKQMVLAILAFTTIGGMISSPDLEIELIDSNNIITFAHLSPIIIFNILFNAYASVWLIIMLRRNLKSANTKDQIKIIHMLSLGMVLAIFLPIVPNLARSIFGQQVSQSIIFDFIFGSLIQNAGILLVGFTFYRISNNPWLLQQQKVYLLVVYSHNGIELFSKSFSEEISPDDLTLLAGGFSAISSMFQEITDAEGIIKAIVLEDKELRIIKKTHFISAILVDYSTEATEEAHKSFTDVFQEKYKTQLEGFTGEVSKFQSAKSIAETYFY